MLDPFGATRTGIEAARGKLHRKDYGLSWNKLTLEQVTAQSQHQIIMLISFNHMQSVYGRAIRRLHAVEDNEHDSPTLRLGQSPL